MKPKKLFTKLFPSYLFISLLGLVILLLITRFAFKNFYFNEVSNNLNQKSQIIKDEFIPLIKNQNLEALQKRVQIIAKKSESRLTVVLPDGKVISDSHFEPSKMENHKSREEISGALKGSISESIRHSKTLDEEHLYLASPLIDKDKIIGVLRVSVSVKKLKTSLFLLTRKVILWSLILLVVLTYIIIVQSKRISAPIEDITALVDKFTNGDFENKIELQETSSKEVASLYSAIELMSERIQTQIQKINKQKNEQLAVFASMLEGVITIYPDMNIYHINKAALNLFQYKQEGPIKGIPLMEVVKSERIYNMTKKLLEDHQTVDNEYEYDSGLILNVHGTILESESTGMLGAVLVFNDITKMRELENHRKQFVANVSHELKTPLTAIQGYLETLQEEEIDDKEVLNKFLGIINKHSNRLKTIIEDLLALSSIERESEIGELKLENISIWKALDNALIFCKEKAESKNIKINKTGPDQVVLINQPLIEQAIINLLDNAIKYGPENSEVNIETKINEKILEIVVVDKGQGIPEKHHERLFERFYSVDKARSRELGGSGLGLAIVKHIALSHGGNVRVQSTVGEGSSFIFELPINE
ncbi:MAG: hypothetical protein CME70_22390 [Halobacteriovorax sp.]|nr:hypothetical protein [Halobacteriovorax sp.]|tara:strand:+ start:93042 stop:94817 length:1776 start_codon:yes stop_codon:yes gene_type:complete